LKQQDLLSIQHDTIKSRYQFGLWYPVYQILFNDDLMTLFGNVFA